MNERNLNGLFIRNRASFGKIQQHLTVTKIKEKIEKFFITLNTRQTGNIFALSVLLIFAVLSLIRLYPFENTLKDNLNGGDDWNTYARYALDITHNGISMPSLNENYWAPASFLYNYFIALSFYLFGENDVPVFIIQNILLGLSVVFIFLTFRDKMKSLTSIAFFFTLFLFALVDVSKYYSFRLLSENLALFTMSAFFYCFIKGIEKNKLSLQILASVLLGLSVLIRPNVLPFEIIIVAIAFFHYRKAGLHKFFLFILFLTASSSLLAIRNYYVTGSMVFLPTQGISFGSQLFSDHDFSARFFLNKIIFLFGFLTPLEPDFQWRPHWTMMWIGYFIYLFFRLRENKRFEIWEVTSHLYIFCYFSLLLFIAPKLGSYGFRLLLPAIYIVLPFSFMSLDKLAERHQKIKSGKINTNT